MNEPMALTETFVSREDKYKGRFLDVHVDQITLPNGKRLEIKAKGVSDKNRYIKAVRLNGKVYDKSYFTHSDLMNGGTIEYVMASRPDKKRCLSADSKPYSLSD